MAIRVYACMIVNRKDGRLQGFLLAKDKSKNPYTFSEAKSKIMKMIEPSQMMKGEMIVVAKHANEEEWI